MKLLRLLMSGLILASALTVFSDAAANTARDAKALRLYLQDKKDHKAYCPSLKWKQPSIVVYKQQLASQLPRKCKK